MHAQDTTNKWSLQKCVAYAVANNLTVKQADIQRMYAAIELHQSNMTHLPTLGGSVTGGFRYGLSENPTTGTLSATNFFSSQAGLQSNYTIFNWFARRYNIETNKLGLDAAKAGIDRAQNDISLSVANTFLQAMLSNENVNISRLQLNQTTAQLNNTVALYKAGTVPEFNVLQLQSQLSTDSANLIQANSNYQQSLIQLKALLNLPQDTAFQLMMPPVELIPVEPLSELEPGVVYNLAIANQPLQKINVLRLKQASTQVKAARAGMYPTVFAQGSLSTSYVNIAETPVYQDVLNFPTTNYVTVGGTQYFVTIPQTKVVTGTTRTSIGRQLNKNFGQSIGVGVSFNIFNQHQARSQWERAKVQVQQYAIQQQQDNASLQSNIYNAYQLAIAAMQKYYASVRNVETNERSYDLALKRNTAGLLTTIDLIITGNNLSRARFEMAYNRYDYIFKMKVLEFYKGNGIKL